MSKTVDKQTALCQALAIATRQEVGKDFDNLATMVKGLAADLERTRAELAALREHLEASQLKKAARKATARASAAQSNQAPPQESAPANAMLFFVRQLVDDVEGVRAGALEDLPDADALRALAETAPKNERGKLLALAEKWTGTGSELFPADWRALGRVSWKHLAKEIQNTIRAAFKASRTNAASA